MYQTDFCIVAGRRPDLLAITMESITRRILSRLTIGGAFMNLDPVFGDETDHQACKAIFKKYFPHGTIFEPGLAGFASAVQRLWKATTSDFVLHFEDDWVTLCDVGGLAFQPFDDLSIAQVSFHTAEKNWNIRKKGHLHRRNEYFRLGGIKLPKFKHKPIFTTSPSILRGGFARHCAALMDARIDPEKQFYSNVNKELEAYVAPYRNYIFSPENAPVVRDIGRDWQEARGIRKAIKNSVSTWERDGAII
jgi:hypothetical protein